MVSQLAVELEAVANSKALVEVLTVELEAQNQEQAVRLGQHPMAALMAGPASVPHYQAVPKLLPMRLGLPHFHQQVEQSAQVGSLR